MNFSVMLRWLILLIGLGFNLPVIAQPITPTNRGAGTTIANYPIPTIGADLRLLGTLGDLYY